MTLPLVLRHPEPALPLSVVPEPQPDAVCVLRDWAIDRGLTARGDPWGLCWEARDVAPAELLEQARNAAAQDWAERTDPRRLERLARGVRGHRVSSGLLVHTWVDACRWVHVEALHLAAQRGIAPWRVTTWSVHGRYGCAGDVVRFDGGSVKVSRSKRIVQGSRQRIPWPEGAATPARGWQRWKTHIERTLDGVGWHEIVGRLE